MVTGLGARTWRNRTERNPRGSAAACFVVDVRYGEGKGTVPACAWLPRGQGDHVAVKIILCGVCVCVCECECECLYARARL